MGNDGTYLRCLGCAQAVVIFQEHVTLPIRTSLHVGTGGVPLSISAGPPGCRQKSCGVVLLAARPRYRQLGEGGKQELSSQDGFLISESGVLANA